MATGCATKPPPRVPAGAPKPYRVGSRWYRPVADASGFRERGLASWYGSKFHGRKTASGEPYNMHAMSAAHKTLPLGTWVRVTNLDNHKTTEVRINDRGPFVPGRIIDLSYKAAKVLGVVGPGTARVEIVALGGRGRGPDSHGVAASRDYDSGRFAIQVGAFQDPENAQRLVRRLNARYGRAHMIPFDSGQGIYYRVRVGRWSSLKQARAQEGRLIRDGYAGAVIVAE